MAIDDKNLRFHESFAPDLKYISKILELAQECYEGEILEISKITGIPSGVSSGKVKPSIIYASYMGLIDYEVENCIYKLSSTDLGKIIFTEDPFLMEKVTKSIMNYNLTDKNLGAPQWCYLFKVYSGNRSIAKSDLKRDMEIYFNKNNIEMGPIIGTYKNDFSDLKLIDEISDNIVFNKCSVLIENIYVYGYTLLKTWEELYPDRKEITILDVLNDMKWGIPYGFDYDKVLEALELLEEYRIIKLNKQLSPLTIIKLENSDDIKFDLYSMLI